MIQTYITSTEANYYFPNDTDYSSAVRADALSTSFGLVNSFISADVVPPVVGYWDGESTINAPQILKLVQGQLYRYVLQSSNDGYNEELEALFNAIADKIRGLKQHEVSLPSQIFEHQVGWNVVGKSISGSLGDIDLYYENSPPLYKRFYNLVVTASGYAGSLTYDVYRDDSPSVLESHTGTYSTWTIIDNSFSVRFVGYLDTNDSFRIAGIPDENINAINTDGPKLRMTPVAYGYNQSITKKI